MSDKQFEGLPGGRVEVTPLPNLLFTELLPAFGDLAEAQVSLYIYFLLTRKKGSPRRVTLAELRADPVLRRALSRPGATFEANLDRALTGATERGALIRLRSPTQEAYFFNTAESRRAVEQIERGELELEDGLQPAPPPPASDQPNIFQLYEQNIGVLTPGIAEDLKLFQEELLPEQITDAFRIARENDRRSWSYVRRILLNWTREAKHEKSGRNSKRRKPQFQGKFADLLKKQNE